MAQTRHPWIRPKTTIGRIAVMNGSCLIFLGLLLIALERALRSGLSLRPPWWQTAETVLIIGLTAVAFPTGWTIVFCPFNGHFWGVVGEAVWRRHAEARVRLAELTAQGQTACTNRKCGTQFELNQTECPRCGTRTREPITWNANSARLMPWPVACVYGVIVPGACGGIGLSFFFWDKTAGIVGAVIGAAFIYWFVHWLNQRSEPRRMELPAGEATDDLGTR
jgi:hypothetical protein